MNDLLEKAGQIETGLKKLLTLHDELKKENLSLKIEIQQFKKTIEQQQEEIRRLENGENAQPTLQNEGEFLPQYPEKLRQRIDEMILEVEKCLSYLNQ